MSIWIHRKMSEYSDILFFHFLRDWLTYRPTDQTDRQTEKTVKIDKSLNGYPETDRPSYKKFT